MNVLIISPDGKDSVGAAILREAAARVWSGKHVFMTVEEPKQGMSLAVTHSKRPGRGEPPVAMEQLGPFSFVVKGTPADALYLAFCWPELVLGVSIGFDYCLTGISQGHNVGLDTIHSGTVAVAALAASAFGVPSMAFSQKIIASSRYEESEPEYNDRGRFVIAEKLVPKFLSEMPKQPGYCATVNFPAEEPKGYKRCPLAMRSRWYPDTGNIAREDFDADWLEKGFVTISDINLSLAEVLRL